jgi:dynein heavy chain
VGLVKPSMKAMLMGHLGNIEDKLKPGIYVLTWTSLNIDGYLHHLHQACPVPSPTTLAAYD